MVYRHRDVQQPAAIAFDVAAPVDSRDGILGVFHALITYHRGIKHGDAREISHIWDGSKSSKECGLADDGLRCGSDVLLQGAFEGCRMIAKDVLTGPLMGEIGWIRS